VVFLLLYRRVAKKETIFLRMGWKMKNATESLREKHRQGGKNVLYLDKILFSQLEIAKKCSTLGGIYLHRSV
jgi:hypothetical protein